MKDEWERPDTIDSVEKFADLTDDDLYDLWKWAVENRDAYEELMKLVNRESHKRKKTIRSKDDYNED